MNTTLDVIGAAVGHCAEVMGADKGPDVVKASAPDWPWKTIVRYDGNATKLNAVNNLVEFSNRLSAEVNASLAQQNKVCVIGGDHSSAVGTWLGANSATSGQQGLIWIDAHMDAHTLSSSPSGNLHGIPVAVLLGQELQQSPLIHYQTYRPDQIIMIGMRSYEPEEQQLLQDLGVKVYYIEHVLERGFSSIFDEAINSLLVNYEKIGLTIDLDGFDPKDCPAVGTPVDSGIPAQEVIACLQTMDKSPFTVLEITEFNPDLVLDGRSLKVLKQLVNACYS